MSPIIVDTIASSLAIERRPGNHQDLFDAQSVCDERVNFLRKSHVRALLVLKDIKYAGSIVI